MDDDIKSFLNKRMDEKEGKVSPPPHDPDAPDPTIEYYKSTAKKFMTAAVSFVIFAAIICVLFPVTTTIVVILIAPMLACLALFLRFQYLAHTQ